MMAIAMVVFFAAVFVLFIWVMSRFESSRDRSVDYEYLSRMNEKALKDHVFNSKFGVYDAFKPRRKED
jgi:hypothetical protein